MLEFIAEPVFRYFLVAAVALLLLFVCGSLYVQFSGRGFRSLLAMFRIHN